MSSVCIQYPFSYKYEKILNHIFYEYILLPVLQCITLFFKGIKVDNDEKNVLK